MSVRNLPQELVDKIVDVITGPKQMNSLLSCALVSRAFTFPAQKIIFRTILLRVGATEQGLEIGARLSASLSISPHLSSFIRNLTLSLHPEIMEPFLSMDLPQLRVLSLLPVARSNWDLFLTDSTICTVVALFKPTIRSVKLDVLAFKDPHDFGRLIRGFGPHVQRLSLRNIYICGTTSESRSALPPPTIRPQIRHLSLWDCEREVPEWLIAPLCSLDFGHLVELRTDGSACPAFVELLRASQSTLKSLTITQRDLEAGLTLSFPLPALETFIAANIDVEALPSLAGMVSDALGLNSLHTICVCLCDFGALWPEHAEAHLLEFDQIMSGLPTPALDIVSLGLINPKADPNVDNGWFPCPSSNAKEELVLEFLPMLNARELVFVATLGRSA
ncbi:hypothetical protein B0H16DRAFT_1599431 [Mycena metata]|uniref:F-box domain-containing protein n=1 Tax=Mycena metata TaxID=1033252 RepID=A0AAD7HM55_9AGAR|nr:hypothetical protein B0H16DRAFT_1599431 [Mycena metata]